MTAILSLLRSKAGLLFVGLGLLLAWLGFDLAYHGRLKNQRETFRLQVVKLQQVVDGFEQIAKIQSEKQAVAAVKAKAVGARTAAIVKEIQSAPAPKTAEEVRQWLIAQGKVVAP